MKVLQHSRLLGLDREHLGWDQPPEVQRVSLFFGKRRPLVDDGIVQDIETRGMRVPMCIFVHDRIQSGVRVYGSSRVDTPPGKLRAATGSVEVPERCPAGLKQGVSRP
jgi:hypothetical protein